MNLDACRNEIDKIDEKITALLEARLQVGAAVAAYKETNHLAVHDGVREAAIIAKVAERAADKETVPFIRHIYEAIMDESKAYERVKMKRD